MKYRVTSQVVGTLELPQSHVTLQHGMSFVVDKLNEELLYAKGYRHVRIEEIHDEVKVVVKEEQKNEQRQEEEQKKRRNRDDN